MMPPWETSHLPRRQLRRTDSQLTRIANTADSREHRLDVAIRDTPGDQRIDDHAYR